MKKPLLIPSLLSAAAIAVLLVFAPLSRAQVSASASASVHLKLKAEPGGMFLVGRPAVPIVRPHRITLGLVRAGTVRTRVFGLGVGRVVFVGARARPFVLVGAPMAVVGVGSPGVVVGSPGVVVGAPVVVVQAPQVVVGTGVIVDVGGHGKHGKGHSGGNGHGRGKHKGKR